MKTWGKIGGIFGMLTVLGVFLSAGFEKRSFEADVVDNLFLVNTQGGGYAAPNTTKGKQRFVQGLEPYRPSQGLRLSHAFGCKRCQGVSREGKLFNKSIKKIEKTLDLKNVVRQLRETQLLKEALLDPFENKMIRFQRRAAVLESDDDEDRD